MTSPREQAIEEAAKAMHDRAWRCIPGGMQFEHLSEGNRTYWLGEARTAITAYESARARLDGAKMMPREATEAAISAFYVTVGEMSASETRDENGAERLYRAMHDATPRDGERG